MTIDNEPKERGQIFTVEDDVVVVEYYHFGEDVAYEFAVQVRLDEDGQAKMATALGLPDPPTPDTLLKLLKDRFRTHDAVRAYADANDVPYELKRDMQP
jgi:hypothetical protein